MLDKHCVFSNWVSFLQRLFYAKGKIKYFRLKEQYKKISGFPLVDKHGHSYNEISTILTTLTFNVLNKVYSNILIWFSEVNRSFLVGARIHRYFFLFFGIRLETWRKIFKSGEKKIFLWHEYMNGVYLYISTCFFIN